MICLECGRLVADCSMPPMQLCECRGGNTTERVDEQISWLEEAAIRARDRRVREILGRYPEMTEAEAAAAAGEIASLFFADQGSEA